MKQMVRNWKQLETLEDKIIGTKDGNIEIGKNLEVEGHIILNSANDLINKEGEKIIPEPISPKTLYMHVLNLGQGTFLELITEDSEPYTTSSNPFSSLYVYKNTYCGYQYNSADSSYKFFKYEFKPFSEHTIELRTYGRERFESDTVTEF